MPDQPRKNVLVERPDGITLLAAHHLDATEGPVQVGKTLTSSDRAAINQVLRYVAKAHNAPDVED